MINLSLLSCFRLFNNFLAGLLCRDTARTGHREGGSGHSARSWAGLSQVAPTWHLPFKSYTFRTQITLKILFIKFIPPELDCDRIFITGIYQLPNKIKCSCLFYHQNISGLFAITLRKITEIGITLCNLSWYSQVEKNPFTEFYFKSYPIWGKAKFLREKNVGKFDTIA